MQRLSDQGDYCDCCFERRKAKYQRRVMVISLKGTTEPRLQYLCGIHAKHPRLPSRTDYSLSWDERVGPTKVIA